MLAAMMISHAWPTNNQAAARLPPEGQYSSESEPARVEAVADNGIGNYVQEM